MAPKAKQKKSKIKALAVLCGIQVVVLPIIAAFGFAVFHLLLVVAPSGNRWAVVATAPLLEASECIDIVVKAEEYAVVAGWASERHRSYSTVDLAVKDIPSLQHLKRSLVDERIFPALAEQYGLPSSSFKLHDFFVVKYDERGQRELSRHRDGSQLTFTIALSALTNYSGGGSRFPVFDTTLHLEQGQVLFQPSRLLHEGMRISTGMRYILVGFVKTVSRPSGLWYPMWGSGALCLSTRRAGERVNDFCASFASAVYTELEYEYGSTMHAMLIIIPVCIAFVPVLVLARNCKQRSTSKAE